MNEFRTALENKEFIFTCEFVPGRGKEGPAISAAVDFVGEIKDSVKIHGVSLTDSPGGNPAILPEAVAIEVEQQGTDAIVHFATTDMSRNAIESRAMTLARQGLNNLLVVTGDFPSGGYLGRSADVFDLDSVQTIKYLKDMNGGLEVPSRKPGKIDKLAPTDFLIGAAVSPFKLGEDEYLPQLFKMERKSAAGADFFITQLGYDMRKCRELLVYMRARNLKTPVIGNVYVLSYGAARVMSSGEVPGCVVTKELLETLKIEAQDDDKGKGKRLERAAKMTAVLKGLGFSGVHLGGFALKTADFKFIIERSKELESDWEKHYEELCYGRDDEFYLFPKPASCKIEDKVEDPVPGLGKCRKPLLYALILVMHKLVFEEGSLGYKFMKGYYKLTDKVKFISLPSHLFELMMKKLMFGCQDCGDCGLPDVAYCCPQSKCAKQQRNGPCGGSKDGMCEVYPDEKPCVWTVAYKRLKGAGRLNEMRDGYVSPRKTELEHTSGWANYFLGRDHSASVEEEAS
jgi:methylenetetrahydrofolate reductase (NADPH)